MAKKLAEEEEEEIRDVVSLLGRLVTFSFDLSELINNRIPGQIRVLTQKLQELYEVSKHQEVAEALELFHWLHRPNKHQRR